jgi:hypothetical protein
MTFKTAVRELLDTLRNRNFIRIAEPQFDRSPFKIHQQTITAFEVAISI